MNKLLASAAAAASVVTIIGPVSAQSASPPPPAGAPVMQTRVKMLSDRVMTRDEMVAHVRNMFAKLDTNRDGFLTREETAAGRALRFERRQRAMAAGMPKPDRGAAFDRLDSNHDGAISRQEFMAGHSEIRQERRIVLKDGADGRPAMHSMQRMGMRRGMMGHMFEMVDADRDSRVSLAEATNAVVRHFDQLDLNHDGRLTPEERRQAHQAMRAQRGG